MGMVVVVAFAFPLTGHPGLIPEGRGQRRKAYSVSTVPQGATTRNGSDPSFTMVSLRISISWCLVIHLGVGC